MTLTCTQCNRSTSLLVLQGTLVQADTLQIEAHTVQAAWTAQDLRTATEAYSEFTFDVIIQGKCLLNVGKNVRMQTDCKLHKIWPLLPAWPLLRLISKYAVARLQYVSN